MLLDSYGTALYRGADKSLARSGRKQANVCQNGVNFLRRLDLQEKKKKHLMTARVSMLLKSRASLTCFRAWLLPGRAKDLSAPRYVVSWVDRREVQLRAWQLDVFNLLLREMVITHQVVREVLTSSEQLEIFFIDDPQNWKCDLESCMWSNTAVSHEVYLMTI